MEHLSEQEYSKIWDYILDHGDSVDRVLFVLMGQLGMRRGEVVHIKKDWIDFQEKRVKIPEEDDDWTPKTPNSARVIPYRELTKAEKVIPAFFEINKEIPITTGPGITYRVKSWVKDLEITTKVSPHVLRATAAMKMANEGFSSQALKSYFGWADLQTADKYIHNSSRAAERDLERLGEDIK